MTQIVSGFYVPAYVYRVCIGGNVGTTWGQVLWPLGHIFRFVEHLLLPGTMLVQLDNAGKKAVLELIMFIFKITVAEIAYV